MADNNKVQHGSTPSATLADHLVAMLGDFSKAHFELLNSSEGESIFRLALDSERMERRNQDLLLSGPLE